MHLIPDLSIDFAKYLQQPAEAAKIRPASDWCQRVIDRLYGDHAHTYALLPWSKTHHQIQLRPGEVSVWAGYNGSGKSMMLNQVMLGVMKQGEKVCIASLEMKPEATMARMSRQAAGDREPSIQFIKKLHQWTDGKLWIYDQCGAVKQDRILAVCRYCSEELGITHIVIDSLMKCGINPDDYNAQKALLDQLCNVAKDTGLHIHLVAHSRKGESEKKKIDKMDIKGAGEITDLTDNVFMVSRNKHKEDAMQKPNPDLSMADDPDALLVCCKQRHGEWEGLIPLWYNLNSFQYVGHSGARPIDFIPTDFELDDESRLERVAIQGG